ncbi:Aminotransferase, class IV [Cordyceps fumosorosea ARSEF 2679]|uniref:Aminotransferase, class IV n=1 Tax=Cordyceps fumosorosea (strain ARSEF 2679) TaxID=1081104 RepID=A0A167QJ92_CORFA|nr:Aminotransferase, class IV [Cordyceps fumosorosea ARSEF 2679]OAA57691.1 Aminotransferase, class IV [Cordyceps fumosorosea ARSEF 2679]
MPGTDDFYIFTSLRYDPSLQQVPSRGFRHAAWNYNHVSPFYCLDHHRDRLLRAATHWGWQSAVYALTGEQALTKLADSANEFLGTAQMTPVRLRIIVHAHGTFEFQKFDTPDAALENLFPLRLPAPGAAPESMEAVRSVVFALLRDDVPVPSSEFTHHKTSKRDMYNEARTRAGIKMGERKEVLMVNAQSGEIMEGSITTPYFWRNGQWITPPVSAEFSSSLGSGGNNGTSRRYALENKLAVEEPIKAESLLDGEECWISNGVSGFIAAQVQLSK